jgi:XLF-Cernunnos, XRcc4-like factor, NHEJ component
LPPLLISTTFTSNSYKVDVTDLTHIWSESLDRRSIIRRSLDEDTSIDPSEDAEQLRVFLDKIQSALSGGENTTLSLQAKPSLKSKDAPSLDLYITAQLPKGLQPLQWPFHLTLSPQSELSAQLTIPILRAQSARMKELERLVEMLRDKDHVIQKLVDKLETTGAELGHVFPGAAGKGGRKIPRKLAEERVKGLGLFEVEEWKKEMRLVEKENSKEDLKVVVREVYEEDPLLLLDPVTYSEAPGSWLNWWENVKENPVELSNKTDEQKSKNETTRAPEVPGMNEASAKEDGDDFQIQTTPPHLGTGSAKPADPASSPPTLRSKAVIQDSTDDEDDLDAPSQHSVVPDSVPLSPPRQQPTKIGAIGRSKPAPAPAPGPAPKVQSKSKSPVPQAKANGKHPVIDDEETASEDEDIPQPAKSPTPPKPASPAPSKANKGGLGKISGKTREATPLVARAVTEENTTPEHKPKHKLGVIGHKAPAPAPEADVADETRGRGAGVVEEEREEGPRETSRERADRKREELKRALEEKARVPVRKKRKF